MSSRTTGRPLFINADLQHVSMPLFPFMDIHTSFKKKKKFVTRCTVRQLYSSITLINIRLCVNLEGAVVVVIVWNVPQVRNVMVMIV